MGFDISHFDEFDDRVSIWIVNGQNYYESYNIVIDIQLDFVEIADIFVFQVFQAENAEYLIKVFAVNLIIHLLLQRFEPVLLFQKSIGIQILGNPWRYMNKLKILIKG